MKTILTIITTILVLTFTSSCRTVDNFDKRKYTDGQYHDLNLFKDNPQKADPVPAEVIPAADSCRQKVNVIESITEKYVAELNEKTVGSTELLHENYPMLARQLDSAMARQAERDSSSWMNDTLPDSIESALSSQAMLGLGTVGGLVTIAAPESIWFFAIPMIGAPFFLLASLIAAAIAMSKLNRGEIDSKYRGAMRLWAVCLLINLILGSLVLMHYMFL